MALPKFNAPMYTIIQPSTQKEIRYRPFLVKEEKILLMAKESGQDTDQYNAVKQIVNNCVMEEGFDVDAVPIYDLEYLFIKIRAISVSNIVKFQVEDSDDGILYDLEVDLDDVEVQMPENHSNKVMINDDVGIIMKPPTPQLSETLNGITSVTDVVYETVKSCIDYIFDAEDTYLWSAEPEAEREVLLNLVEQIIELLAERVDHQSDDPLAAMVGITVHDTPPEDEVLLRLLPNAYADQVDASEFRRYTESTLRQKKQAHAMAMRMHLKAAVDGVVELDHDSANAWLGAMNDVRLALGVRLKVEENTHQELELLAPDDPMRAVYAVYTWLGWLQETLVEALMDEASS